MFHIFRDQKRILHRLESIERKVHRIMLDLSALSAAVAEETDVVRSVSVLLDSIAAELQAAQGDPDAVAAAVATIRGNSATLAAAVAKNTPVAPSEPQEVPQPEPTEVTPAPPTPSEPSGSAEVPPTGPTPPA